MRFKLKRGLGPDIDAILWDGRKIAGEEGTPDWLREAIDRGPAPRGVMRVGDCVHVFPDGWDGEALTSGHWVFPTWYLVRLSDGVLVPCPPSLFKSMFVEVGK